MMRRSILALPLVALLASCDLAPRYTMPTPATPGQWPVGPAYAPAIDQPAGLPWRTLISDGRLRSLIERALANNQDLRATVANVAAARAQYRVQRSQQLPTVGGGGTASIQRFFKSSQNDLDMYDVNVGVTSFEVDLFGRLKNLSKAAFEQYLATDAGMRSARIALVASTAGACATLASDRDLLAVAQDTLKSGQRTLQLTRSLHGSGLDTGSDVADAETVVAQAESDIAQDTTLVAQDRNALELLVGGPVDDALLPASLAELDPVVAVAPAGLSSTVLLQRPDVLEAEHRLKGANASIGAARAAFFPTITLTSAIGVASTALSALFTGGALNFLGAPKVALPVLGGANRGNLAYAKAERDYYLAQYRYSVQTAFREVADDLARRGTIDRQRAAQERLVATASTSYRLADAQYRAGTDTFLAALIAQRTLYAARQSRVVTVLADLQNRISLYATIGSDPELGADPPR